MRYNVKLKYFEHDDTGIKGFAHMNTYNTYDGFDPFWIAKVDIKENNIQYKRQRFQP